MALFIVTVKLGPDPERGAHNPARKVLGFCPAFPGKVCTDSTGAHHSTVVEAGNIDAVRERFTPHYHVTRIEEVV